MIPDKKICGSDDKHVNALPRDGHLFVNERRFLERTKFFVKSGVV